MVEITKTSLTVGVMLFAVAFFALRNFRGYNFRVFSVSQFCVFRSESSAVYKKFL